MPYPSHFLGAGNSPLSTSANFGGTAAVVGAGTTAADATLFNASFIVVTGASNSGIKLPPT